MSEHRCIDKIPFENLSNVGVLNGSIYSNFWSDVYISNEKKGNLPLRLLRNTNLNKADSEMDTGQCFN